MKTVTYKQRDVSVTYDEYVMGIRNLTPEERGQVTAVMYDCGMVVPRSRGTFDECANKISKLLDNPNIMEYAPRLVIALDGLQTILEYIDIVHGIAVEY